MGVVREGKCCLASGVVDKWLGNGWVGEDLAGSWSGERERERLGVGYIRVGAFGWGESGWGRDRQGCGLLLGRKREERRVVVAERAKSASKHLLTSRVQHLYCHMGVGPSVS
ncbi:unnamed protein product [Prunus armeniaca]